MTELTHKDVKSYYKSTQYGYEGRGGEINMMKRERYIEDPHQTSGEERRNI